MVMSDAKRYFIILTGIVQGVGLRPFVYRAANRLGLKGWVENQGSRVLIDVEGGEESISSFAHALQIESPENARIAELRMD